MCRTGATIRCPDEYGNLFSSTNARSPRWTTRLASPSSPAASAQKTHPSAAPASCTYARRHGAQSCSIRLLYQLRSVAAAAPTPGRACAVSVHREPAPDAGDGRRDRRRRDPHDGDRRACGCGRGRARGGSQNQASEVSAHYCVDADSIDPVRARGGHRLARPRRQRELDRDRARRLRRPAGARLERRLQPRGASSGPRG